MNLSLTVIANMTSNYSEGLGNVSSVQKVFRNGKTYAIRSRESLKNAIMVTSGMYDDLEIKVGEDKKEKVAQKNANQDLNASNCKALEGGYMNTSKEATYIRNSSFYLTDAISCDEYVIETRFHNNLFLAQTSAKQQGLNLQGNSSKAGLMPYQYEYDKGLKIYSLSIDLDLVGKDENFKTEADSAEKISRVNALLTAIEELSLVVKGNLDNAEPVFVVGGMTNRKSHYFENLVHVKNKKLVISEELIDRVKNGCKAGLMLANNLENEDDIKNSLNTVSISSFFSDLRQDVSNFYGA